MSAVAGWDNKTLMRASTRLNESTRVLAVLGLIGLLWVHPRQLFSETVNLSEYVARRVPGQGNRSVTGIRRVVATPE